MEFPLSSKQKGGSGGDEREVKEGREEGRLARASRVKSIFNFQLDSQVNFFRKEGPLPRLLDISESKQCHTFTSQIHHIKVVKARKVCC